MSEIAAFPLPFHVGHKVSVMPMRTLRELEMMYLSAVIREKPAWHVKMNDAAIVARWTRRATTAALVSDVAGASQGISQPTDAGAEVLRRRAQRENVRTRILALRALISMARASSHCLRPVTYLRAAMAAA